MDDLIAFLNARYDEAAAPRAVPDWHEAWCLSAEVDKGVCFYCGADEDPAKVEYVPRSEFRLADIASKRQIIAKAERARERQSLSAEDEDYWWDMHEVIAMLALPFASHPDYREDWHP